MLRFRRRRILSLAGSATLLASGAAFGQTDDLLKLRAEVIDTLRSKAPDLQVNEGSEDGLIRIGNFVVNLGNLYAAVRQEPDGERRAAVVEFAGQILLSVKQSDAESNPSWSEARVLLRPRLVPQDYPSELVRSPFAAGLTITFVIDLGHRVAFIDHKRLEKWGVAQKEVREIAYANLERLSADLKLDVRRPDRGLGLYAGLETSDSYAAARLVLPGFRSRLVSLLGEPAYVGIPHRDFLIAWSADFDAMPQMIRMIAKDFRDSPYALTDQIFAVRRDGLFLAKVDEPRR